MSLEGLTPSVREVFGGLQTGQGNQTKVPPDKSPLNQNVRYLPGGAVASREGMRVRATVNGLTDILGIKEYVDLATTRRLLVLTDDGQLFQETGNYTFTSAATNLVASAVGPFVRLSSTTLFGKEWIAIGASSIYGSNPPKVFYYDPGSQSVFLDPVAPEGPGHAPTVATSAAGGNVSLGEHKVAVFYRTRTGYWSQLGPSTSFTVSVASRSLDIAQIATGPAYVTERVIAVTPAFSNNYYFNEGTAMVIKDNTTTSRTIDFTDTALTNGTPVTHPTDPSQDLLRQIVLPATGAVEHYSGRLAWWGFRHQYLMNGGIGFPNMRFQGGYGATGNANLPNGWVEKTAGESKATGITQSIYGEPVRITGTGAANQKGCLENRGQVNAIIPAGVEVWGRVRAKKSLGASGNLYLYFCPTGQAAGTVDTGEGVLSIASLDATQFTVSSFRINTATQNSGYDSNTRFRISVGDGAANSLPNGATIDIDYIEIYTPGYDGDNVTSLIRWSKVDDPEAIDGLYAGMLVEAENGQALTACFTLRGAFYMCKERSMFVTRDDRVSEPKDWSVDEVSSTIGTPSRFGVGKGDGWALVASRSGLYLFDGQTPEKISEEIDGTWARINFAAGQNIWCLVDTDIRRAYVGVPLDGSTTVNNIITLEWDKTDRPSSERVRNYSIWTVPAFVAGFSIRPDGSRATLFGDTSSRLFQTDATLLTDYSTTAISPVYRLAFEQPSPVRGTLRAITAELVGNGALILKTYGPDPTAVKTVIPPQTLSPAPNKDLEFQVEHTGERVAVEISQTATNSSFQLSKLTTWWKVATSGPRRGHVA